MKLVNFTINHDTENKAPKLGIQLGSQVLDINKANQQLGTQVPDTMEALILTGDLKMLQDLADKCQADSHNLHSVDHITYHPVVTHPEKILCIGLNYQDHIAEVENVSKPVHPVIFSKFNNALAGHEEQISLPTVGSNFDYEVELVVVIGKEAHHVSKEEALDYVFGYSVGNDLSVRDLQFESGQWLIGKTPDQFAPVGPAIVTADSIDPNDLGISLTLNGEVMQSARTSQMMFDCAEIISYASDMMTLKPGDLIFTGTPSGVIQGKPEERREWLKAGDLIEAEIEEIGLLRNRLK